MTLPVAPAMNAQPPDANEEIGLPPMKAPQAGNLLRRVRRELARDPDFPEGSGGAGQGRSDACSANSQAPAPSSGGNGTTSALPARRGLRPAAPISSSAAPSDATLMA